MRDSCNAAREAFIKRTGSTEIEVNPMDEEFEVRAKDVEDLATQIKAAKTTAQRLACIALAKSLKCSKMIPDNWNSD